MLFFWVGDDDTHLIFLADTVRPEKGNFLLSELSGLFPAVLGTEPHVTPTASASKLAALATTLCVFLLASPPPPLLACDSNSETRKRCIYSTLCFCSGRLGREGAEDPCDTPRVTLGLSSCIIASYLPQPLGSGALKSPR